MTTAEEAKTKWCPFARVGSYQTGAVNRSGLQLSDWPRCIADGCMAWEWRTGSDASWSDQKQGMCGLIERPNRRSEM